VAELVRADVDASGEKALLLLRRERPIVPDDVVYRIGHRRLLSAVPYGRLGEMRGQPFQG
jgi:hypothetical protein